MNFRYLLAFALILLPACSWFDRSQQIFFPKSGQETVALSQSFPVFWWNFVISENKPKAQALCQSLKSLSPELLTHVECNQDLKELQSFVVDWAQDLPLRADRPSDSKLREDFKAALAQASLPTGDRSLIKLLQADPTQSWKDLKKLVEQRIHFNLDPDSRFVVIPIQAGFSPGEAEKTRKILDLIQQVDPQVSLVGPHGSTLRNHEQVANDLNSVSKGGYAVLVCFGLLLLVLRRGRLLLLFPPVFLAVGVGTLITVLIFGSIHGLTLSLGAGIIGLALDYGFNAALSTRSLQRLTWRSNLVGVATTLVGLFVIMMSSIPLLRQMMVFSAAGLFAGFLIFRFLIRRFPSVFISEPLGISFKSSPAKTSLIAVLLIASLVGLFVLHPNLDMKQFDFQDSKSRAASDWLYKTLNLRPPLFSVNGGASALAIAHQERDWADHVGVPLENLAMYLPNPEIQKAHLATWNCESFKPTETERKFFGDFFDHTLCHVPQLRLTENNTALRSYDRHLNADDRWVTLWMPTTDAQEKLVRESQPRAHSLREIVMMFPQVLARELSWMAPLSLLIVFFILLIYYRRLSYSLVALVPFFSGLGLFTFAVLLFKLQISFISVIALVMSFGFSFDYAVFAVDHYAYKEENTSDGVWEAISWAACATLAGFVPLLFCKHPVLSHLGQALCISTVGCYLGAIWGVSGLMEKVRAKK